MEQTPRPSRRTISTDGFLHTTQFNQTKRHYPAQPVRNQPNLASRRGRSVDSFTTRSPITPQSFQPTSRAQAKPAVKLADPSKVIRTKTAPVKPKHSFRKIVKRTSLVFVTLFLLGGGWLGWKVYRNVAKVTNNNNPFSLLSAFQPVTLKGQDTGRVNILLAGNSTDDPGHSGASLTDSIMILSVNTRDKTAFMLSVPRDLWVNIPSMGYQKINAAGDVTNFQASGYPNGSMGQLEQLIHDNLGININYYALINYTAFRDAVNAVGGITINIQSTDPRGLYDSNIAKVDGGPLKLANGVQTLNGQTALNLARARGDGYYSYGFPGSDFDRTAHQRQMLLALKAKASSANVLSDPLKIGKLADAIGNNLKTDMQLNEMETLYSLTKDLNTASIASYNVNTINNKQLLANYTSPDGQSALIPAAGITDFSNIQAEIKKLLSTDPVVKENATAVVLNGSSITGLAKQQGQALENKGLTVAVTADAPAGYTQTAIIDNSGGKKPSTKAALQVLYGVTATTDATMAKDYPSADFIIILGLNYQSQNQATTTSQ